MNSPWQRGFFSGWDGACLSWREHFDTSKESSKSWNMFGHVCVSFQHGEIRFNMARSFLSLLCGMRSCFSLCHSVDPCWMDRYNAGEV